MKVILLQDVAKIGRRHTVVEVPDGYALNQLIPKRLAEPATPQNLRKIERKNAEKSAATEAGVSRFADAVAALEGQPLVIIMEANEQGHLFQQVHEKDVIEAARAKGVVLEPGAVVFAAPIKEVGTHTIPLKHGQQTASCVIDVQKK